MSASDSHVPWRRRFYARVIRRIWRLTDKINEKTDEVRRGVRP